MTGFDPFDDGPNEPVDFRPPDPAAEADLGCDYCLAGFVPAGTHPILGPVYRTCTDCNDRCPCCQSTGLFPADTTCIHCLTDALATVGLTPVFCHTCAGVTAIHPATEVTP